MPPYRSCVDNISSKIVPLEKGTTVIYGANALLLLPVVHIYKCLCVIFLHLYILAKVSCMCKKVKVKLGYVTVRFKA